MWEQSTRKKPYSGHQYTNVGRKASIANCWQEWHTGQASKHEKQRKKAAVIIGPLAVASKLRVYSSAMTSKLFFAFD